MPDLIAQGPASGQRWRREIPAPTTAAQIVLGRTDCDWEVPWDGMISRRHVRIVARDDDRIEVTRIPTARNPVFHQGDATERFVLVPGDHFVIGHTTFTLANRPGASDAGDLEVTQHSYDPALLRKRHYRDAASRLEILSRLPDLIAGSESDEELLVRVTGMLLQATTAASAVAVVAVARRRGDRQPIASWNPPGSESEDFGSPVGEPAEGEGQSGWPEREPPPEGAAVENDPSPVRVLHYDCRSADRDGPPISGKLVRAAVRRRESILHLWAGGRREGAEYTMGEDVDWAFCAPLRSEACPGWAIYVTGQLPPSAEQDRQQSLRAAPEELLDDVKFAELVGQTVGNLRQSRRLQRRQAAMRHFFAPVVMEALAGRDTDEVLAPREAALSVLFCDLRGFTRQTEQDADHLLELLARVSDALGVMTRHILDTGGVIGDFHGDAAMGFWGWPLDQPDTAVRAAETAIRIRDQYASAGQASGFRCGIGIASGRAVAGRIGTSDQVKVTAFGPVVNLASRLEGITKAFAAEIIIDETTAEMLRDAVPASFPHRLRRLARVRPAGLTAPVEVSQLLSRHDDRRPQSLTDEQIADYQRSLEAFHRGDWDQAYELLHHLPAWDRPKDLLISTILRHGRVPPASWDGVIDLPKL